MGFSYCYKDDYLEKQHKLRSKSYFQGRTELSHLAVASEGSVNSTTLQLPTTEYHTVNEKAAIESCAGRNPVLADLHRQGLIADAPATRS